jgi:hypothetical protein
MSFLINKKLALYLIPMLVLAVFCQSTYALEFHSKKSKLNYAKWSIETLIDERIDNDDDDYYGLRLSLKNRFSNNAAVRFNLSIVGQDVFYDIHDHDFGDGFIIWLDDDRDFDVTGVNFSLQYLFYPAPNNRVNFFWGAGPYLSINESNTDLIIDYYDYPYEWSEVIDRDDVTRVGVGMEASIGMEMFLGRNFSLIAEYGLVLQHQWFVYEVDYYDNHNRRYSETESLEDGLHLDASRVRLGVAIHF